jgi:4-carboxymuconolactone decarboxylase
MAVLSRFERWESMDEKERYQAGNRVRREVLGDAHVDRSNTANNDFDREFVEFFTRFVWGEVWTRPGLARTTRSMITIASLVALGRTDELRLHLRGALTNGVTPEQIREVLINCAVYCGVPAANTAFHIAKEVLKEAEEKKNG